MRTSFCLLWLLAATPALAADDPIADCQASYANDPTAHIACLEAALRARMTTMPAPAPTSAPAPETAADTVALPPAQPSGMGSEQVLQSQRASGKIADDAAQVVIVAAEYGSDGLGTFTMEDGQVWRETEKAPTQFHLEPGRQYDGRIERGKIGGYRLYVDGVKRMLKVKRLN